MSSFFVARRKAKKRYKGLGQTPKYISPALTYNKQRDYCLKSEQRI